MKVKIYKYIITVYSIYVKLNTNQKTERFFIYYHNKKATFFQGRPY